jgi:4-alpha-glucanotransferase
VPLTPSRRAELDAFAAREGQPLQDFALWCALEEHYLGRERPAEVDDIRSPLVAELRTLADRVAFHVWLQWIADQQVADAQAAARRRAWRSVSCTTSPSGCTRGVGRVVAAGDVRDRHGGRRAAGHVQPAGPDLESAAVAAARARRGRVRPLRDMIRTLLRHAGALRIDHVIGLFRLWWIPEGLSPAAGTYVRYDHEAMIGVLLLEAHRAGAVLIGEDLGNVEPWVREYLSARGVLGTSVLWFEREGDGFRPPEQYRRSLLATVNTHDLPPTAGYLADEHVALRARLGLLTRPVEEELADADAERATMLALCANAG